MCLGICVSGSITVSLLSVQTLLDDAHRQIHNQEKMIQHVSHSLREKDKLLQEYMRLVDDQEVRAV